MVRMLLKQTLKISFFFLVFSLFAISATKTVRAVPYLPDPIDYCPASCYNSNLLPDTICQQPGCSACQWCRGETSLSTYQTSLQDCCNNQSTSLNCYAGDTLAVCTKEEGGTLGFTGIIVNSFNTMIGGSVLPNASTGLTVQNDGAIGGVSKFLSYMYLNPPVSSAEYLADLGNNLGIIKPAYAQGTGFKGLEPILGIWKSFRDVAYIFFVLVFLAIGFMIMFRVKVDPRTVITIQNSIPKIIITMILVTFSYAIAGLVIDLMYLFSAIGISLINPTSNDIFTFVKGVIDSTLNTPVVKGACVIAPVICNKIGLIGQNVDRSNPSIFMFLMSYLSQGNQFATTFSHLLSPPLLIGEMVGAPKTVLDALTTVPILGVGPAGALVSLILGVVLLFALLKTLFSLVGAYVRIIISVILAPLQIMLNAIPGQNTFGSWLRNLISNVAVFPTIIIYLALMARVLAEVETGQIWSPPLLGISGINPPTRILVAIIGYGMLLLLPKTVQIVQDTLKVPAFKYGSAIGEAMKPVTGPLNSAWKTGKGFALDTGKDIVGAAMPTSVINLGGGYQQPLKGSNLGQGNAGPLRRT